MNWKFWVKPTPEVKTVDSVVQQFDQMVTDLYVVADGHKDDIDEQGRIAANALLQKDIAEKEYQRAISVASKIKDLVA